MECFLHMHASKLYLCDYFILNMKVLLIYPYLKVLLDVWQLGDNTFVIEWFAGINCIILRSQILFYRDASAKR